MRENEINGKAGPWPVQHPGLVARLRLWRAGGGGKGWGWGGFVDCGGRGQEQARAGDLHLVLYSLVLTI